MITPPTGHWERSEAIQKPIRLCIAIPLGVAAYENLMTPAAVRLRLRNAMPVKDQIKNFAKKLVENHPDAAMLRSLVQSR